MTSTNSANGAHSSAAVWWAVAHLARQLAAACRWGWPEGIAAGICRGTRLHPSCARGKFSCKAPAQPEVVPGSPELPVRGHGLLLSPSRLCHILVNSSSVAARQQKGEQPSPITAAFKKWKKKKKKKVVLGGGRDTQPRSGAGGYGGLRSRNISGSKVQGVS